MRALVLVGMIATVLLAGDAVAAAIQQLSRTVVAFAYVSQGFTSPVQPVFVTNTGDAPLTIGALTLEGSQPGDFGIATSGTCTPPIALGPGERCRIDLVMTPVSPRNRSVSASVFVHTTATLGSTEITLTGTVDPALSGAILVPAPAFLDFQPQAVGDASAPLTLVITNAAPITLTLGQLTLLGGDATDFAATSDCTVGQVVAHNHACAVTVTFTPRGNGPRATELVTEWSYGGSDGFYRYSVTGTGAAQAQPVTVVEYYNATLDHYFITWVPAEQANLDAGNTPTRWVRTGQTFRTWTSARAGTSPVCRYYIPPGLGDSHFFGRGQAECDATGVKNPSFVLESPEFMDLFLPIAGACPAGTGEIYRVFSNRPDANHRYMTDPALRDQMVARGWLAEGDGPNLVVMCWPQTP